MTPFQEFRMWARRAPLNERVSAGVATAVVLALLVWLLVPSRGGGTNSAAGLSVGQGQPNAATNGQASGAGGASTTQSGGGASAVGATSGAGGVRSAPGTATAGGRGPGGASSTGTAANGAHGCASPPSGASGVTAKQIKVAVTLVAIGGAAANSTFGVATVDQQKGYYQAAIDDLNASGGVACRKVVPEYYQANPADQNDLQQKCLDIAQAGVFAVLDPGAEALNPLMGCYAQHHIAYFGGYLIAESLRQQFYPYLFEFGTFDQLYHDTVLALKAKGFFDPAHGFKKLGFPYRSCYPQIIKEMMGWLNQAGVPSSQIVTYDVGCPSVFANPSDVEQAVLKFQRAGVTNVTTAFFTGDFANFTNIAQQQGFHPKYGVPDDDLITVTYGNQHPNYQNINGAIAVAAARDGEETTPGTRPTAGTARCDAIFAKHGIAPTYKQPYAGGNACDEVWMFAAAVEHAPMLAPNALAAGLQAARSVEFSFPQAPNDFASNGVTTGGQFWRLAEFTTSGNCWRVTDPTFRPSTL